MRDLREIAMDGLVLSAWARADGWSRAGLYRQLKAEGWQRVVEGAWLEPGAPVDLKVRLLATQWTAPYLVVSHSAAAWLRGIELPYPEAEFTAKRLHIGRHRSSIHRIALPDTEVTELHGLRCTTVDRTLADLLRQAPQDDAITAVESALTWRRVRHQRRRPLTTLDRVGRAAGQEGMGGRVGALKRLRLVDTRSASPAETVARLRMAEAGLHPTPQVELTTHEGRLVRPDFFFVRDGVVVEIEGYAFHGTREAHRRDVERFNDLQMSRSAPHPSFHRARGLRRQRPHGGADPPRPLPPATAPPTPPPEDPFAFKVSAPPPYEGSPLRLSGRSPSSDRKQRALTRLM
ncbi:hypothetical protein [Streptomyces sp. NPDC059349]|uniref:hypothetical protein n=1 Tax=Streptomyces sp. NPDC059349 TaxID=3346808 RepID=UPI00367A510C